MRLKGFYVDDSGDLGITGTVPLPGVTILFGRNGAGKSRLLELFDSFLTPGGEFRGRTSTSSEVYGVGSLFCELDGLWDDDQPGPDARWLTTLLRSRPRVAEEYLGLGTDKSSGTRTIWEQAGADDAIELDALAPAQVVELGMWLPQFLSKGLPELTAGLASTFWMQLLHPLLVAYQNLPFGFVDVVADTSTLSDVVQNFATVLVDGRGAQIPPAPIGSLTRVAAERLLAPRFRFESLFQLAVFPNNDEHYEALRADHPEPVWISADPIDIEQHVQALLPERIWAQTSDGSGLALNADVSSRLKAIQQSANNLAPEFVRKQGRIVLAADPNSPNQLSIKFSLDAEGIALGVEHLSSGIRRWVAASVLLACARVPRGGRPHVRRESAITPEFVLLIDEPELHLHETAQADIAKWMVERSAEGALILAASHSSALLDLPAEVASLVAVTRSHGRTQLYDMTADVLDAIDDLADVLGLDRRSRLRLARGVLVVEGEHDLQIVRHFFSRRLAELRLLLLPLRGCNNVMAIIDSEFLGQARVPQWVMLDDIRAAALAHDELPENVRTTEEKKLRQLLLQKRSGHDIRAVAYSEPDILCALPSAAVRRAYPECRLIEWAPVIDAWRSRDRTETRGFKKYALDRIALKSLSADAFVEKVLLNTRPSDEPSPALTRAVEGVLSESRSASESLFPDA